MAFNILKDSGVNNKEKEGEIELDSKYKEKEIIKIIKKEEKLKELITPGGEKK